MTRTIGVPALAVAAALAWAGVAAADDRPATSGFGTTMTLGGQGTVAQAAADDTELAGYRKFYGGYYGGYRNYYGGFGYRGYGYNGFGYGGFYPGYYGGFNRGFGYGGFGPSFYTSFYSRSFYPYGGFYPYYGGFGYKGFGYGYGNGFFLGIGGTKDDAATPVVSLGLKVATNPTVVREPVPVAPADGTFRYDGGPANPVPLPVPEAGPPAAGLPISLPKARPAGPYTYKAYGEK